MKKLLPINRKKTLVLVGTVIALLLVAGATYATLNIVTKKDATPVENKTGLVEPSEIQESLITANDSAKRQYDAHNKAAAALNEEQVKLIK